MCGDEVLAGPTEGTPSLFALGLVAPLDRVIVRRETQHRVTFVTIATPARTYVAVLTVLGATHLVNDLMQSLIPAAYPILKEAYGLDFVQIGLITLTFQIAGSLLQPVMGTVTDRYPAPFSPVFGMAFTLSGLVCLAFAGSYAAILVAVGLIGIGSSIFHPEATRMARYAAGDRQWLAQGIFQAV